MITVALGRVPSFFQSFSPQASGLESNGKKLQSYEFQFLGSSYRFEKGAEMLWGYLLNLHKVRERGREITMLYACRTIMLNSKLAHRFSRTQDIISKTVWRLLHARSFCLRDQSASRFWGDTTNHIFIMDLPEENVSLATLNNNKLATLGNRLKQKDYLVISSLI